MRAFVDFIAGRLDRWCWRRCWPRRRAADDVLEEVIVTATLREQALHRCAAQHHRAR